MTLPAMLERNAVRCLGLLLMVLVLPGYSAAQHTTEHLLHAGNGLPAHGHKVLMEVLLGLDDRGRLSVHEDQVKVRCSSAIDRNVLLDAFDASGLGPFTVIPPVPADTQRAGAPPPFELPPPTGDAGQDRAAYDAAKRAWAEGHPDAYRAWTGAHEVPTPAGEPDR